MAEMLPDIATLREFEKEAYAQLCQQPERRCPACKVVKPALAFFVYHPYHNGGWWHEARQCQPCYQSTRERSYPTCCLCAQKKPLTHFIGLHGYSVGVDGRGCSPCCRACIDAFRALPEPEQRCHIRSRLDSLYPAASVIYALLDPKTQEVRYIGRTSNLSERYQAHLKSRAPMPDRDLTGPEPYSKRNWIQDLFDQGLKPVPTILHVVETGPLIVEWEGRYIAHGIQQRWPLLNTNDGLGLWNEALAMRLQASQLDCLHAPFAEVVKLAALPNHPGLSKYGFAGFVRAWYVDEQDILPEASQATVPTLMQAAVLA